MKGLFRASIFCFASAFLCAQSPAPGTPIYSFKENRLGMSKADFMETNGGWNLWVITGKPNAFGKGTKKHLEATPFCTDRFRWDGDSDLGVVRDGEVVCDPSPSYANPEGLEINGKPVDRVRYHFYGNRLFEIVIAFDPGRFDEIVGSFRSKYGDSARGEDEDFQNVFGARWSGRSFAWKDGTQRIAVFEGSGNGPGYRSKDKSYALFEDTAYAPPLQPKSNLDF